MFGLNVGVKIFQYHVTEVLKHCKGFENISDNTVVYGKVMKNTIVDLMQF